VGLCGSRSARARRIGQSEKTLKNAKTEFFNEHEEIATAERGNGGTRRRGL